MKSNKLVVKINKPAEDVFDFALNPKNTPKWIDFIKNEETNEWPPRKGTVYRNQSQEGNWNEYKMTDFEQGKMFVLSRMGVSYNVRYTLKPIGQNSCELEYYEWVDEGELDEPFTMEPLEKLKEILEKE